MEADARLRGQEDEAPSLVEALRHRHRNQIQVMTSLVGLFGRRASTAAARNAFADLRARFEALSFPTLSETPDDEAISIDLPELADRLIAVLDAGRRHDVRVTGRTASMSGKAAAAACQLLAEMMIALYRIGLPEEDKGSGHVIIELRDRGLDIRVEGAGEQRPSDDAGELGWTLAESHALNCGGELVRGPGGVFRLEAKVPIGRPGR